MASVDTSDSDISRSSSTTERTPQASTATRIQNGAALNDDPKALINIQKLISRDGIFRAIQMGLCLLAFIFVQTARWCRHEGEQVYVCDSDRVPVYRFFPAVTVTSFAVTFLMCSLDVTNVFDRFHEDFRGWPIVILLVLTQSGLCAVFLFFASAVLAGEGYTSNGFIVASVFGFLAFVTFALHFALIFTRQYKQAPVTSTQTQNSLDIFASGATNITVGSHNENTDPVEAQIQQPTCSILLMRPRGSPSVSPQVPRKNQESYGHFHNERKQTNENLDISRSPSPISQGKLRFVCHDSNVYNCSYSDDASEERLSSWDPNATKLYDNLSTDTFTVEAAYI